MSRKMTRFFPAFSSAKKSHLVFAACLVLFCTVFSVLFSVFAVTGSVENTAYPLTEPVENYNPYVQQFDAFKKGRLSLDIEPAPELAGLENPYDPNERFDIFYLWDRAYYKGEYFSYFGIAPILTLYYPWFTVTGGLPSDRVTLGIFSAVCSLFFVLAVIQWVNKFKIPIPLPLLALGCVSALGGTGIFLFERGTTPFYFIAVVAASAFASAFAFFALTAFFAKRKLIRRALMFFAGVSFALAFLSRINSVLPAAVMIACAVIFCAVKVLKTDKKAFLPFAADMLCLAFPVVIGMGAAFVLNFLRFGDPLEFGTTYQLTVSDVSLNTLYLAGLSPTFYHYFCQLPSKAETFPFIGLSHAALTDYGKEYVYVDANIGLFSFPGCSAIVLIASVFRYKERKAEKLLLTAGFLTILVTAFLDFCLGGVIFRYIADISVAASLIGTVILFYIYSLADSFGKIRSVLVKAAVCAVLAVTVVIAFGLSVSQDGNLTAMNPKTLSLLERLFSA